ncbi:MATE family efflux transporter [Vibrio gallicus]|uniref:MATE family efflux transporter n=1 Tax=Vibrio gallicus TaxID=190897 RepID=UPI0021C27D02|nr:MATE family efflux transporter [Vibrio gallicus]
MQSMLMIDTFLISPLGEISLAAMGIASTIVAFIMGIQMALANGSQLVLSRAVGSGVKASLARGYWAGMIINLTVALFFLILLQLFNHQIIEALTDDTSLYAEILSYLSVSQYLVLYTAVTQISIALFNASGQTKVPFKGYLIEMPINALLSYLFIHGWGGFEGHGVKGAALGSVVAITIRAIYLYACMHRWKDLDLALKPHLSSLGKSIKNHFLEIFPIAANVTILSIGATLYQLIYSQLSLNAYVAITLIFPWIRSGSQFITAWSISSAIAVSQAIGSNKMDDLVDNVDKSIDVAIGISFITALLFGVLSLFIGHFYPDLDPVTYAALAAIAPLYVFLPIARGYNTVHGNVLRALGKTTAVFKINFTGQWIISIPLCALIVLYFDGSVFWAFAIQPFEELIKMLPFRHLARKSLREFDHEQAKKLMYD